MPRAPVMGYGGCMLANEMYVFDGVQNDEIKRNVKNVFVLTIKQDILLLYFSIFVKYLELVLQLLRMNTKTYI